MDVIGFLCVSLGSSTVQLRDSLSSKSACARSEVGFSSQNCDRAWGVYYRRSAFCCAFLWAKGLNEKNIHKERFPVCDGKCLSRKAFHDWVEKFSQRISKVADDSRRGRPVETVTEATMQRVGKFIRADRRITIDSVATGQMCQCRWRTRRKIYLIFSSFYYYLFYVLHIYLFVTYLQTLPRVPDDRTLRNTAVRIWNPPILCATFTSVMPFSDAPFEYRDCSIGTEGVERHISPRFKIK
jgi:hypothetical protein